MTPVPELLRSAAMGYSLSKLPHAYLNKFTQGSTLGSISRLSSPGSSSTLSCTILSCTILSCAPACPALCAPDCPDACADATAATPASASIALPTYRFITLCLQTQKCGA